MTTQGPMPPKAATGQAVTAERLFGRLWDELVGLVGTAATAALLRRALKRAAAREPEPALPVVQRDGLGYVWVAPEGWRDPARGEALEQLRRLAREDLPPLFRELTGPVIARRLASDPELVDAGIARQEDGA